jgi:hypothetical protein
LSHSRAERFDFPKGLGIMEAHPFQDGLP